MTTAVALRCPVCGSDRSALLRVGVREDPRREVFVCEGCDLHFLEQTADLAAYYQGEYRRTHNAVRGASLTAAERFDYMLPLLGTRVAQFKRHVRAGASVLDFGCSSGFFMHLLRGEGYRVSGVELNAEDVVYARSRGLDVADDPAALDMRFDAIAACHVLEHLPDPRAFVEEAFARLEPGGKLYIEIPNADDALLSYGIPEFARFYYCEPHLWYFRAEHVRPLLAAAGFAPTIEFRQDYSLANAYHWLLRREPQPNAHVAYAPTVPDFERELFERFDREYRAALEARGTAGVIVAVGVKEA